MVVRPVGQEGEAIRGGLWARRQRVNREVSIPLGHGRLEDIGSFENFRRAASRCRGGHQGKIFSDSEVYKWLEALAWEQARQPSSELASWQHSVSTLVAEARAADGYVNTYYQLEAAEGDRFTDLASGHELYCLGHLMQAAVAQRRSGRESGLVNAAQAAADHLVAVFGSSRRSEVPGHPEVEMALTELSRTLERPEYLALAVQFIDNRGAESLPQRTFLSSYLQDGMPVREAKTVVGHAVRAVYLAAGATDVMMERRDETLQQPLEAQWRSMVQTKSYLTGGIGSRWKGESFGDAFELPPDRAYCETCAAVGVVGWSWRMLLATGEPGYADHIERVLYNAVLPGVSDGGDEFAYINPLQLRASNEPSRSRSPAFGRQGWFSTACCISNLMRTVASLQHYLLTSSAAGLQIQQFMPGRLIGSVPGGCAELIVDTDYPWEGAIEIEVADAPPTPWELAVRIPAWCVAPSLQVNGVAHEITTRPGYARLQRRWQKGDRIRLDLPMPVRQTVAHPRVDAVRGCVALERGPLVYCFEQANAPRGAVLEDLSLVANSPLRPRTLNEFGGIRVLDVTVALPAGAASDQPLYQSSPVSQRDTTTAEMTCVPYFLWGDRGPSGMRVWVPLAGTGSSLGTEP